MPRPRPSGATYSLFISQVLPPRSRMATQPTGLPAAIARSRHPEGGA